MDRVALRQAKSRLAKAEAAVTRLNTAKTFDETETSWSDFLTAAATIYTKLEQGSKTDKKSLSWFSRIKGLRRSDPLLRYVHQARNSDEHGIVDITLRKATRFDIGMPPAHQRALAGFTGITLVLISAEI
jgi:hypothetical protein